MKNCWNRSVCPCLDCKVDTMHIGEWYMVLPEVWEQAGLKYKDGYLCIGCLEERIGYVLCPEDFEDYPVNKGGLRPTHPFEYSERLALRLGGEHGKE